MATITTVKPLIEPVTLQEAKDHLNIDHALDDAMISVIIQAARERIEQETGRALITQTLEQYRDNLIDEICLNGSPVQAVSNIAYLDSDNAAQTLATSLYDVDSKSIIGRVTRSYNATYPSVYSAPNAVTITYTAGYGSTAADVPAPLRSAILLLIGLLYENRESVIIGTISSTLPMGITFLIAPYRVNLY